jgi:hypothetical protein
MGKNNPAWVEIEMGCYRLDIRKGEEVILYQDESMPDGMIKPLPLEPDKINHFGIN